MKRTKYPIHPDFKAWTNLNPPLNRAVLPMLQKLMGLLFDRERSTDDMTVERKSIPVGDGASIRALWYCPKDIEGPSPCLVYYHGGGFVFPASPQHYSLAREYAQRARCRVLLWTTGWRPSTPSPRRPRTASRHTGGCWTTPGNWASILTGSP